MANYSYVLLDADNTLLDFDASEQRSLQDTFAAFDVPVTPDVLTCYHKINRQLWTAFEQGDMGQEEIVVQRFHQLLHMIHRTELDPVAMNERYMDGLAQWSMVLPGAVSFCRTLAQHCVLAIITNGVAKTQHGRLDASPLRPFFSHLFISAELGTRKPNPAFFDQVCGQMGISERHQAVVVGDSLTSDILGGIQAGIDTIWFNPKGLPHYTIHPTWQVSGFEEATALILGA